MRVILQRVSAASVSVDDCITGEIGTGLLVLAGFENSDQPGDIEWMVRKIVNLRIFPDQQEDMTASVKDIGGGILAVSQFTLFASTKKGSRPSWHRAAKSDISRPLFDAFCLQLAQALGKEVEQGVFGADMAVSSVNQGPVTITLDSKSQD